MSVRLGLLLPVPKCGQALPVLPIKFTLNKQPSFYLSLLFAFSGCSDRKREAAKQCNDTLPSVAAIVAIGSEADQRVNFRQIISVKNITRIPAKCP